VTQQNAASSEESSSAAAELSSQSDELAQVAASFRLDDSSKSPQGDFAATFPRQVKAAIAAHGMWKTHLVAAITTVSATVNVEDAGRDDRCKFGKWLHGTAELRGRSGFDHIKGLHAEFHRCAADVLRLAVAGEKDEARGLMDSASTYTRTSTDLTRELQGWSGC